MSEKGRIMLKGKTIIVGVSGGIAAYKTAALVSALKQAGAEVYVLMTKHAMEFVGPATFEALSGHRVISDTFHSEEFLIPHIRLGSRADLLIAADCTAYAYGNFHADFISGRVTLIGCPKLDAVDYSEKLSAIIASNDIRSITVTRMEVPCCGGLELAVRKAVEASGRNIPVTVVTITADGNIIHS